MFDGMHHQDQLFHQFISSSPPSSSRPPAPTTSLHQHHHLQKINSPFPNFDNSSSISFPTPSTPSAASSHHHRSIQFHDLFHRPNLPSFPHLNQASSLPQDHHLVQKDDVGHIRSLLLPPTAAAANLVERERSSSYSSICLPQQTDDLNQADDHDIWSNDEVVALLRIRSSSESSWFPPEFTWEHVSRKLAEIGFKRSAEKCKQKFEEESRTYFNTSCFNINTYNNNSISGNKINSDSNSYKVFSDLEEFCGDDNIENNNAANADDQVQDPINNEQHQDMEVESSIGCENSKSRNVIENITAAVDEIEKDANYPSPMHSQPDQLAEPHEQSDAAVDRRERQLKAKAKNRIKKRNKEDKLKKMKVLCERFVNMMMAQQEELHNKILDDLLKRDEDTIAREESWKWMENERLNTEIEMRALEQATAGDRQAAIIEFMNKFSTTTTTTTSASKSLLNQNQCIIDENIVADLPKVLPKPISDMSKLLPSHSENGQIFLRSIQNPSDETPCLNIQTLLHETLEPQTPTSKMQPNIITKLPPTSNSTALLLASSTTTDTNGVLVEMIHPKPSTKKAPEAQDPSAAMSNSRTVGLEDYGKRWPREQVLALIDLRCSFMRSNNNNGDNEADREPNGSKAPLWERISQKMFELGYKRSAKRCKEKWENINKYFRKTKDNVSKKRSLDSRTCPYFHQLSHLYKQGTLVAPSDGSENHLSTVSGNCFAGFDSLEENASNATSHVGELRIRPEDE
ncbi:unnamed protein product [Rhodiola kirilowii]